MACGVKKSFQASMKPDGSLTTKEEPTISKGFRGNTIHREVRMDVGSDQNTTGFVHGVEGPTGSADLDDSGDDVT